jgi:phosphatidylglycerophosphatase A
VIQKLVYKFFEICSEELAGRRALMARVKMKDPDVLISTWFGSGFLFPAAGTWGTLAAFPIGIPLLMISKWALFAGFLLVTIVGYFAVKKLESRTGIHDSPCYVIDEVSATFLILLTLPAFNPLYITLAFLVYRAFDTLKPWPVSWADRSIPGAWGVMIDDLMAAVYSILVLWGIFYVFSG